MKIGKSIMSDIVVRPAKTHQYTSPVSVEYNERSNSHVPVRVEVIKGLVRIKGEVQLSKLKEIINVYEKELL